MDNLTDICSDWLDNADLDINFQSNGNEGYINLIFYVVGTNKKVHVNCKRVVKFSVDQESGDTPLYLVLQTSITLRKKESLLDLVHPDLHQDIVEELWHVNVSEGDAKIHVISEYLSWEVSEISSEER